MVSELTPRIYKERKRFQLEGPTLPLAKLFSSNVVQLANGAICDGEGALRRLRRKYLFVGNTLRDGLLYPATA